MGTLDRPSATIDATGSLASPPAAAPVEPARSPSGLTSPSPAPGASPGFTLTQPAPSAVEPAPLRDGLSDIASLVNSLPQEEAPSRPAPAASAPDRPAERPRTAPARAPAATRPAPARTTAPAHPSRHWVQVAGGANRAALPAELARLRAKAPELVNRTAWTTPLNATNRLLVGPFPSAREAQEFVNRLAERDVAAFAWTSPAGQEIHRLTGR